MTQCDEAIRRQLHKPTIYMVCGVPGSGKTYFCKNVLMDHPWCHRVYISSDDIRKEICGDASNQSKNSEVFDIFYDRARQAIQEGNDVILDATHLTKKIRNECRKHFEDLDCKFIAVQMMTSIEEAIRRNKNRDRIVPDYAMRRMAKMYQPVKDDENFDYIWKVE